MVRIPDGVPFEQAAFVEPVNTVLKGVKLLNLRAGRYGAGHRPGPHRPDACRARRAAPAPACSPPILYPERHAIAADSDFINPIHAGTENVVERVFAETEGRGADAVILAVGGNALIQTAMDAVRPGGKVMLFAQTQHGEADLRPRRGLYGREDPARLLLFIVRHSG